MKKCMCYSFTVITIIEISCAYKYSVCTHSFFCAYQEYVLSLATVWIGNHGAAAASYLVDYCIQQALALLSQAFA